MFALCAMCNYCYDGSLYMYNVVLSSLNVDNFIMLYNYGNEEFSDDSYVHLYVV